MNKTKCQKSFLKIIHALMSQMNGLACLSIKARTK